MNIRTLLLLSFIGVAIFSGIIGFIAYMSLNDINNSFEKNILNTSEEIKALQGIRINGFRAQMEVLSFVSISEEDTEGSVLEGEDDEFEEAIEEAFEWLEVYIKYSSEEDIDENVKKLKGFLKRYETTGNKVVELVEEEKGEGEIFEKLEKFEEVEDEFIDFTDELFEKELSKFQSQKAKTENIFNFSTRLIVVVSILAIVISIFLGYLIARMISNPLEKLKESTNLLAHGEFQEVKETTGKGEIKTLIIAYNQMLNDLKSAKIVEEKRNELELSNSILQAKNDALDTFVYRVSHDLKAPTVNISMLTKMLKRRINNDDAIIQETIRYIQESSNKLNETILDLLEVSRIDRNLQVKKENIQLEALFEEIKAENAMLFEEYKPTIQINFSEASNITFGKVNLKSILSNLVTNAIKYAAPDRPSEVSITTHQRENGVELIVKDNGLGMDLEMNREKLFGMFSRFHDHVEGSGVGLYIVNKIITESGGTIEVESEVNKGTTFKVFFKE